MSPARAFETGRDIQEQNVPELITLLEYWHSLECCDGAKVPAKSALNPADIADLLPFLTLHERLGRYDMRAILTGIGIDDAIGRFTSQNLFDFYPDENHEFYANLHDDTLGVPCGTRINRTVETDGGQGFAIKSIHLPLANAQGDILIIVSLILPQRGLPTAPKSRKATSFSRPVADVEYLDLGYGVPPGKTA